MTLGQTCEWKERERERERKREKLLTNEMMVLGTISISIIIL